MNIKRLWLSMVLGVFTFSLHGQNNLTFKEALNIAQKNNIRFKAEKFNSEIAKSEIKTATIRPNPSFNISWQQIPMIRYSAENSSLFSPDNRQLAYQVSQSIPIANQRKYKIKLAQGNSSLNELMLSEFQRNLFGEVAQKWLDVWFAKINMNILVKAKQNSDSLLNINTNRLKNQVITSTEFLRTKIIDEQYGLMLLNAIQIHNSEMQNLSQLLGIGDSLTINDNRESIELAIPLNLDSLMDYALNNRSDILISKNEINNAHTNLMLQKAISIPQPEIGVSYSSQNKTPYIGAYVAIPIPIYDRNQGEIAKANIGINQANTLQDAVVSAVKTEVINAYKEFNTNKTTFEKYDELHLKSEQVLDIVRMSYLKGGTTILDYLEAQKSWFDMETQYYQALYNYRKSFLQLLFATNLITNIQQ